MRCSATSNDSSGHDASFRQLATIRSGVFERLLPLAPDGLASSRRGDLLARFVGDVDELQNVPLRVVQPLVSAAVVLVLAVVGIGLLAPASALAVLACLVRRHRARPCSCSGGRQPAPSARLAPLRGELQAAVVEHVQALEVLVAFDAADAGRAAHRRPRARGSRAPRAARAAATGAASASMTAIGGFAVAASLAAAAPLLDAGRIDGPTFAVLCLVPLAIAEVAAAIPLATSALRLARASAERVAHACPPTCLRASPCRRPIRSTCRRSRRRRRSGCAESVRSGPRPDGDAARASSGAGTAPSMRPWHSRRPPRRTPGPQPSTTSTSRSRRASDCSSVAAPVRARRRSRTCSCGSSTTRVLPARRRRGTRPRSAAVRRIVGLVEQRPWLFDEDVRQNLLFARDTATDEDLLEVLDRVGLREWLAERGGLDAQVGERGALVSGGQAQRIALARAMLADFPVLVLDEPTASVDPGRADALLRDLTDAAGRRPHGRAHLAHGRA